MRKIVLSNRKGGTAKTTSAVNIAAALALAGDRTLLIDTDAQGHCSRLLGIDHHNGLAFQLRPPRPERAGRVPRKPNLRWWAAHGFNHNMHHQILRACMPSLVDSMVTEYIRIGIEGV
jgi:hypothetical protein